MKMLNLLIDIDGTITEPYYWLERANQHFNTNAKPHNVCSYEFSKALGVTADEYNDFYNSYAHIIHSEARIRAGAKEVICRLFQNHNIHYVTAREEKYAEITRAWLEKHSLPHNSLTLTGNPDKRQNAKELNCDIFIEDSADNALLIAGAGYEVLLLDCTYNKCELNANITRVYNWYQIAQTAAKKAAGANLELKTA